MRALGPVAHSMCLPREERSCAPVRPSDVTTYRSGMSRRKDGDAERVREGGAGVVGVEATQ